MKTFLLIICSTALSISLTNLVMSQNLKKMSATEFKKRIVGKTTKRGASLFKFNADGTLTGMIDNKGNITRVEGTWSFSDNSGYCRKVTIMSPNGKKKSSPKKCTKEVYFKGTDKTVLDGVEYLIVN